MKPHPGPHWFNAGSTSGLAIIEIPGTRPLLCREELWTQSLPRGTLSASSGHTGSQSNPEWKNSTRGGARCGHHSSSHTQPRGLLWPADQASVGSGLDDCTSPPSKGAPGPSPGSGTGSRVWGLKPRETKTQRPARGSSWASPSPLELPAPAAGQEET